MFVVLYRAVVIGFQYGFTLDQQKEDDYVFETNGAKLLMSNGGVYFNGATIDYKDTH